MPPIDKVAKRQQENAGIYESNEAARHELATRTDVAEYHLRRLRKGTIGLHRCQLRNFETFMRVVLRQDSEPYTTRSEKSKAPDAELLKRFALYRAQTGVGNITLKLSVWTVLGDVATLVSALHRRTLLTIPKETRRSVIHYIKDHLTSDTAAENDRLSKEMKPKPVATTADIEILLEFLYSSATFENMMRSSRDMLQLAIFICLMVDCCGRGSDVSYNDRHAESLEECLSWRDFALYITNTPTGPTIHGALTIRWMKGMQGQLDLFEGKANIQVGVADDPSKYKVVPFTLMPAHMAHCDALRQLIVLGIIDDVVPSWAEIEAYVPAEMNVSHRFIIPPEKADLPILRSLDRVTHKTGLTPRGRSWFGKYLVILGNMAGFNLPVTGYNLRRGSAYLLDLRCSPTIRKFMMGHVEQSRLFHSTYQSRIAALDVGAVFWGAETQDQKLVAHMIGISQDRVPGAPVRVSVAGERECLISPKYVAAVQEVDKRYAALRAKFDSIPQARLASKDGWNEANDLDQAKAQQRTILNRLRRDKLSEEREAFRAARQSTSVNVPQHSDSLTFSTEDSAIPEEGIDAMLDTVFDSCDVSDALPEGEYADDGDDGEGRDYVREASEGDMSLFVSETTTSVGPQTLPSTDRESQATLYNDIESIGYERCHGLMPAPDDAVGNESLLALTRRRNIIRLLTCGTLPDEVLCTKMVEHFTRLHTDFHFPEIYEPMPGRYSCLYCPKDLAEVKDDTPWEHVHRCATKKYAAEYISLTEEIMPQSQKCSLKGCSGHDLSTKTRSQKMVHHKNHGTRWHNMDPNGEYPCFYGQCSTTTFTHHNAWVRHIAEIHGHIVECSGSQFCTLCEEWCIGVESLEVHLADHFEEVLDLVKKVGYNGLIQKERVIIPKACPFCLHDETLPFKDRLMIYRKRQLGSEQMELHITSHLTAMGDNSMQCPCFSVGFCNAGEPMTAKELKTHLYDTHNLLPTVTFRNGFKRDMTEDNTQLGPRKITRQGAKEEVVPSEYPGTIRIGDERCDLCTEKGITQCRVPTGRVQGRLRKQMASVGTVHAQSGTSSCEGCKSHRSKCSLVVRLGE